MTEAKTTKRTACKTDEWECPERPTCRELCPDIAALLRGSIGGALGSKRGDGSVKVFNIGMEVNEIEDTGRCGIHKGRLPKNIQDRIEETRRVEDSGC